MNGWALARRDLRGGVGGLWLLLVCLAIAVGGLAAVTSVASSIRSTIEANGRELLGADLLLSTSQRGATTEERAARDELARLPATLSRDAIAQAMSSVQERMHDCHVEFEQTGTVNVRLVVEGPTGKVKDAQVLPPFDKSPAGLCVKAALKAARFARTRNDNQEVKLPVYLR